MKITLLSIGLAALCFGGWPMVARTAGRTGATGMLIMTTAALSPIILVILRQGINLPAAPSCWRLAIAGVMMGAGFIVYAALLTRPETQMSVTVPTVSALVIIVTTIGGFLFFSEPIKPEKILGIMLLIVGIILLRPEQQAPSSAKQERGETHHVKGKF